MKYIVFNSIFSRMVPHCPCCGIENELYMELNFTMDNDDDIREQQTSSGTFEISDQ